MRKSLIIVMIVLFVLCSACRVSAMGPLSIKGGMAVTYDSRPFLYRYDKGPCGKFSNTEVVQIVEDLFSTWDGIKTSEIDFQRDNPGLLSFDVTGSNFDPILNSSELLGYTPIIFDNDGSVLDALYGKGASSNILGLAGPIVVNAGPLANEIPESQGIFNCKFVNGIDTPSDPEKSTDSFKGTIIHETGHAIGLDHSQINVEAIRPGATQEIRDSVPLEFPVAVNDLFEIRRDDASSVSFLYPNESELTKFGKIQGKVFRQDGVTPIFGANVIARNIDNPKLEAISCVSDFLEAGTGEYTLFAVPPGKYQIQIEPIDLSFTEGSGVGPYTKSKTDKSFQNPVPEGFYTGPNQPITTDPNLALTIDIQAGQSLMDANIIASTSFIPGSSSSGSSNINEEEPNNSLSEAQVISPPVTISGKAALGDEGKITLVTSGDSELVLSDLFKFTVSESSSINALLTIESELTDDDLDLVLLNETGNSIIDKSSQTGNVDELVSKSLQSGTYILGVGAFSGSGPYKLLVTLTSDTGGIAVLTLNGPETVVLKPTGMNIAKIKAKAINFTKATKCTVDSSLDYLKIKPRKFSLSNIISSKTIRVKVPLLQAISLIENNTTDTVTVTVTCSNGTSDVFDITISPTFEAITELKKNLKLKK